MTMPAPSKAPTAVIMAGGKGNRLQPLTNGTPKALLPIGSATLLEILVSQMHQAGCAEVVVSLGHLAPVIRAYCVGHKSLPLPVRFVQETAPLGTAGALGLLDPVPHIALVINCDVLTDVRFSEMIRRHTASGADMTILGIQRKCRQPFGMLEVNGHNTLSAWREGQEVEQLVVGGAYVIGRRALSLVQRHERVDMPDLVARVMTSGGSVNVFTHESAWFDLGTMDSYYAGVTAFAASPERFGYVAPV